MRINGQRRFFRQSQGNVHRFLAVNGQGFTHGTYPTAREAYEAAIAAARLAARTEREPTPEERCRTYYAEHPEKEAEIQRTIAEGFAEREPAGAGLELKRLRLAAGYGLREFAELCSLLPSRYCNLENGHSSRIDEQGGVVHEQTEPATDAEVLAILGGLATQYRKRAERAEAELNDQKEASQP